MSDVKPVSWGNVQESEDEDGERREKKKKKGKGGGGVSGMGRGDHECEVCGAQYTKAAYLTDHMRTHTGEVRHQTRLLEA